MGEILDSYGSSWMKLGEFLQLFSFLGKIASWIFGQADANIVQMETWPNLMWVAPP